MIIQAQGDDNELETEELALNMEPRDGFMDDFFTEVTIQPSPWFSYGI